ncbi:MAG: hypothetical protein KDK25_15065 [Leptospiraceae bacterium]|nr:hypothetical protein [Leptospiraceae bacterium]MCB1171666.1 hypothetical protein [Leptospiraceae bacterium]
MSSLPTRFHGFLLPESQGPDRPPYDGHFERVPDEALNVEIQKIGSVEKGTGRVAIFPVSSSMASVTGPAEESGIARKANQAAAIEADFSRRWLFVSQQEIRQSDSDEIFLFDLMGYVCLDEASGETEGTLRGYSETGAHGILEVEWKGKMILVPLIDEHVVLDAESRTLRFKDIGALDPQ